MDIAARIEAIFEERLKALAKELEYTETDIKALIAVNKRMGGSPRPRKQRDPDMPKAPPNGYMRYCQEMRKRIQEENKELSNSEIMKILGEQWKEEPQSVKDKYNNEFKKEKEKYALQVKTLKEQKAKTKDVDTEVDTEDVDTEVDVKEEEEVEVKEVKEVKENETNKNTKKNSLSTLPSVRKLNPNV